MDFMCNECGNCEVFCPYSSAPYRDKLTLYITEGDFTSSDNAGFLAVGDGTVCVRLDGRVTDTHDRPQLPEDLMRLVDESLKKFREIAQLTGIAQN